MTERTPWHPYHEGRSIGAVGSEGGVIVWDEGHSGGARITLERDARTGPFAITCGVYGWMVHTRFFPDREAACAAFEAMEHGLATVLDQLPAADEMDRADKFRAASAALGAFVERFP